MAKYCGKVGFGISEETAPGKWKIVIKERTYYGDVIRNIRHWQEGENINDDLKMNNSISILADAYLFDHIAAVRYIEWMGNLWKVSSVEIQRPRLILQIGGVYNGPKA